MGVIFEFRCTGCGLIITENYDQFIKERRDLFDDKNMTDKHKEEAHLILLNKYGYVSECCRLIVMTSMKAFIPKH